MLLLLRFVKKLIKLVDLSLVIEQLQMEFIAISIINMDIHSQAAAITDLYYSY